MRTHLLAIALVVFCAAFPSASLAQSQIVFENCSDPTAAEARRLVDLHVYGGAPSGEGLLVRRGYVAVYDENYRIPRWTAWQAIPDYRRTPARTGKWNAFHPDVDVQNPVVHADYDGLAATARNLARGHIAPHFISGGDRDSDGRLAVRDIDDACTVFEINLMSNVTPQMQNSFNGSGGEWGRLEGRIRRALTRGQSFHIIAGPILNDDPVLVGPHRDIALPAMFFQIVISDDDEVVPFLFGHPSTLDGAGCVLRRTQPLTNCISTIADIERLTGLDFFSEFSSADERAMETQDGVANWQEIEQRRE